MHRRSPQYVLPWLPLLALTSACSTGAVDDGRDSLFESTTLTTTGNDQAGDDETGRDETGTAGNDEAGGDEGPSEPTCEDGEQNQGETALDCGGPNCGPCEVGQTCASDGDCATDSCVAGVCVEPACDDGAQNGDETDVDCGGSCSPCANSLGCEAAADCQSGVCAGSFCAAPNCGDGVQNGGETATDCGGDCSGCAEGLACAIDGDCLSQFCDEGVCAAADCLADADCGQFSGQCTTGVCTADKTCEAAPANQGLACDDGQLCTTGETCNAGVCGGGGQVNCSGLSNACNLGVCNPQSGACETQPANNGNPCNDGNACTIGEVCSAGVCADPNAPGYVFYDNFSNNAAGWTFGPEWGIGPAAASGCASSCPGNDPGLDHTPTADNGIAGAMIGGCITTALHADYCLTSPMMNTASLPSVWLTYWRHLHSDYTPYMRNKVEVFNGSSWVLVWSSGGSPCINDANWTQMAHDLTAYKATNMRVRFCHAVESSGAFASGGWNLDDIVVGPAQCTP
jgi:hypothetical protein